MDYLVPYKTPGLLSLRHKTPSVFLAGKQRKLPLFQLFPPSALSVPGVICGPVGLRTAPAHDLLNSGLVRHARQASSLAFLARGGHHLLLGKTPDTIIDTHPGPSYAVPAPGNRYCTPEKRIV